MSAPDDYPHRELLISPNPDAGTTVILLEHGADLDALTRDCPSGCTHETGAPECGLDAAVARGDLAQARLESFRRMIDAGQ